MITTGFIQLHRSIFQKQWAKNANCFMLFCFLASAADIAGKDRGTVTVKLRSLSESTGLSLQAVRCSLKTLEKAADIKVEASPRQTKITICNFSQFSGNPVPEGSTKYKKKPETKKKFMSTDTKTISSDGYEDT